MSYIDGFVIAAPTADKEKFLDHANRMDTIFLEMGADRVVEGWGDDIPKGEVTDFYRAVQAKDDETVVFSWIEWPDKATRDTAMEKMRNDERMMAEPMPFDGKRMIFGGFDPIVDESASGGAGYLDGFVVPVPQGNREAYRAMSAKAAPVFKEYGATRHVEAWGSDVPDGKVTDFRRSVQAGDGEEVVFSFIEWPDKATRDEGWKKVMEDERMKPDMDSMPFDGKRMFWGGFNSVVDLDKQTA
jgi:uncharacterized protein YbaA (DUF1428 family)